MKIGRDSTEGEIVTVSVVGKALGIISTPQKGGLL